MLQEMINVKIFRFNPSEDSEPGYKSYEVPLEDGMSAMNVLDYVYQNLDSTLAYYDHAGCCLGICARCTGRINGKPGLLCQTPVLRDVTLEPVNANRVVKDLVMKRGKENRDNHED